MSYIPNLPSTAEMQAMDAAHHIHPFTDTKALNAKGARIVTGANGVFVTDSDGNRLLDGMAGLWCVNVGYGRKEIVEAAARQMEQLPYYNTFFQTSHPPALQLAEKLADVAPGDLNHTFFTNSGSESNDTVIRLVRHYWASAGKPNKSVIISRVNGYHGSTMGGASLGGMSGMHAQGGLPIPGIRHIVQPYWYAEGGDRDPEEFGLECARALEAEIERLGAENVAAFIGEPVQGAGGVIVPPETYWPEIQRICRKHDILLISDEVICGFGRTGNWFGHQTFGFEPDIIAIAKGLSSGYLPIGGVMINDRIAEVLTEKGAEFAHGYTYSGHPASCAAALENLRIMQDENLVEKAAKDTAPYLEKRWRELADHPLVGEVRICGMMGALELTADKETRAKFKGEEGDVGFMCREHSMANGLIMRSVRDCMIISPPLVISHDEIDQLVATARVALDATLEDARRDGHL